MVVNDSEADRDQDAVGDAERCSVSEGVATVVFDSVTARVSLGPAVRVTSSVGDAVGSLVTDPDGVTVGGSVSEHVSEALSDPAGDDETEMVCDSEGTSLFDSERECASCDGDEELDGDTERDWVTVGVFDGLNDSVGLPSDVVDIVAEPSVVSLFVNVTVLDAVSESVMVLVANSNEAETENVGRSVSVVDASEEADRRVNVRCETECVMASVAEPSVREVVAEEVHCTVILLFDAETVPVDVTPPVFDNEKLAVSSSVIVCVASSLTVTESVCRHPAFTDGTTAGRHQSPTPIPEHVHLHVVDSV